MKGLFAVILVTLVMGAGFLSAAKPEASWKIDQLLEKRYQEVGVEPNAPISDEVFMRRVYLDVIGRIPTVEEATTFLESKNPGKRSELIDELLNSEGYVSHFFNYWADVLRINETVNNNRLPSTAYSLWVKQALRSNMPYDQFVRELVSARGYIWENGAVGYYQRDRGMPLDNMSNTVRIFLGTRLECAQCHNHPFDTWTQMDYFHMAAFSYGMDARTYGATNRKVISDYQREMAKKGKGKDRNSIEGRAMRRVVTDLYNPIRYVAASEQKRKLQLPHDYQYDDAKPKSVVTASTMFGKKIDGENLDSLIEPYAEWMTSRDNERFTLLIANRLWKKVMGLGLIEPVDELMESTQASDPELMAFLEKRMKDVDYDMRAFLKDILNTQAYQREADAQEVLPGEVFHFTGPVLRRMSAEQIWDSLITLAVPEPDYYMPRLTSRLATVDRARQIHDAVDGRSPKEFIKLVEKGTEIYKVSYKETEKLQKAFSKAREDEDAALAKEIGRDLNKLRGQSRSELTKLAYEGRVDRGNAEALMGVFGMDGEDISMDEITVSLPKPEKKVTPPEGLSKDQQRAFYKKHGEEQARWRKMAAEMTRASEISSPAPRGHFLREFGQSDREVIENASAGASVPQALSLLNGPIAETLGNSSSVLRQQVDAAKTPEGKVEALYLAMLSRRPNANEMDRLLQEVEAHGDAAYGNIVWALVNSQNFRFIQ